MQSVRCLSLCSVGRLGRVLIKGSGICISKNTQKTKRAISTKVEEDVLSDARVMGKLRFSVEAEQLLENLWEVNPDIHEILQQADTLEKARDGVYSYLDKLERCVFELDNPLHVLENAIVRDAVRVFRSIIGPINERRTGESALDCLWKLANERRSELKREIHVGFLMEMINLFKAVSGKSGIYSEEHGIGRGVPEFLRLEGRKAAEKRFAELDQMAAEYA